MLFEQKRLENFWISQWIEFQHTSQRRAWRAKFSHVNLAAVFLPAPIGTEASKQLWTLQSHLMIVPIYTEDKSQMFVGVRGVLLSS